MRCLLIALLYFVIGSEALQPSTTPCPCGFYCPGGSNILIPCPSGNFCPANSSAPVACPVGHWCSPDACAARPCPCGTYSNITNATSCSSCPSGTFNSASGQQSQTQCLLCPAGSYCPTQSVCTPLVCPCGAACGVATVMPQWCPAGMFGAALGSPICSPCTAGQYCASPGQCGGDADPCPCGFYCNSNATIACPAGTYSNRTGQSVSSACTRCSVGTMCPRDGMCVPEACPRGSYCLSDSIAPVPCSSGSFNSILGQSQCVECLDGHYCPYAGMVLPLPVDCGWISDVTNRTQRVPCPPGTFQPNDTATTCAACPRGTSCDSTAQCQPSTIYCGTYAPNQSAVVSCPAGTYQPFSVAADCLPCPLGFYCPYESCFARPAGCGTFINTTLSSGVGYDCPEGMYQPDENATSCLVCPEGSYCSPSSCTPYQCPTDFYCPAGSSSPIPCPQNTHTSAALDGAANVTQCIPCLSGDLQDCECSPGYFCPRTGSQISCPAGTYNPVSGAADPSACLPCSPGMNCSAGQSDAKTRCDCGHYCPGGVAPIPCPSGAYNPMQGSSSVADCIPCAIPSMCPSGSCDAKTPCPVSASCPLGELRVSPNASCTPCLAGWYCKPNDCDPSLCYKGHYCPVGSFTPIPCPAGTVQPNTGATSLADCLVCDDGVLCEAASSEQGSCPCGSYCVKGIPLLCPPLTYSDGLGMASQRSDCTPFPSGCHITNPLAQGLCGPPLCPCGYYCPDNTTKVPCPAGTFNPFLGSMSYTCQNCSDGNVCSSAATCSVAPCPAGNYCPNATTQIACPAGTWRPYAGASTIDDCEQFPQGQICSSGTSAVVLCPSGTFCPIGSSTPKPCLPGTYNPDTGAAACLNCTAGQYCPNEKQVSVGHNCTAGWYCPEGSSAPVPCPAGTYNDLALCATLADCLTCPDDGSYCPQTTRRPFPCPCGRYCPNASVALQCPNGTVSAAGQQDVSKCAMCLAGTYCSDGVGCGGFACPRGSYCPAGAWAPLPCPFGSFNNQTNGTALSACRDCPQGFICSLGASLPRACPCGTFCAVGANMSSPCPAGTFSSEGAVACSVCPVGAYCPEGTCRPTPCPCGSYCPSASSTPLMCPSGLYNNATGAQKASDCFTFPAGWYATLVGTCVAIGRVCPCGAYCPVNSTQPMFCPSGTYNALRGQTSPEACLACVGDQKCVGVGLCNPFRYCPCGAYCTDASTVRFCPKGTYGRGVGMTSLDDCVPCDAGLVCPSDGVCRPRLCPCGGYCPVGAGIPTRCPAGSFNSNTKGSDSNVCVVCPEGAVCPSEGTCDPVTCPCGFFCPKGSVGGISCPPGSYSDAGSSRCAQCPLGAYCPNSGACAPTPCPCGMYCPTTGGSSYLSCPRGTYSSVNASSCVTCPAGFTCSEETCDPREVSCGTYASKGSWYTTDCPLGTFNNGSFPEECEPCPRGYFCGGGGCSPEPCECGRYCPREGMPSSLRCPAGTIAVGSGASTCITCPPGYACDRPCGALCRCGFYCPGGASAAQSCPPGFFTNETGSVSNRSCLPCPQGMSCSLGQCAPAPCPKGYYCGGAADPVACPPGTFQPVNGAATATSCLPCSGGVQCPKGSIADGTAPCPCNMVCPPGAFYSCPAGTYSTVKSSSEDSGCTQCPSGSRCSVSDKCIATISPCPMGSFCPANESKVRDCPVGTYNPFNAQESPSACRACSHGAYCPQGSFAEAACGCGQYCVTPDIRTNCLRGMYNDDVWSTNSSSCKVCPAGFYCSLDATCAPSPCPCGAYCPVGSQLPAVCPHGTYNSNPQSATLNDCRACNNHLGLFCPVGTCTVSPCACGSYCPNASVALPCPAGTYSNATAQSNLSTCEQCPRGAYCPAASCLPTPCPLGSYCPFRNMSDYLECPAGSYSSNYSSTFCSPCQNGSLCSNIGTEFPVQCPMYYYCPTPLEKQSCPGGSYSNLTGVQRVEDRLPCPAGCECDGSSRSDCDEGYYCPVNTSDQLPCPAGTYQPAARSSSCLVCPVGSYCPTGTATPKACTVNSYCPENSSRPVPCPPGTFTNTSSAHRCEVCVEGNYCSGGKIELCPAGSYCPADTSAPVACPGGTFSNVTSAVSVASCRPCTAGHYCPNATKNAVSSRRTLSTLGVSPPAVGVVTPSPCPCGTYCPLGSASPTSCGAGSHSAVGNQTANASCSRCPEGSYCPADSCWPTTCPCGTYCPAGGSMPLDCPPGTYSNLPNASSVAVCVVCPAGNPCPAGSCAPMVCPCGSLCPSVVLSVVRSVQPGFFSVEGSLVPTQCIPGEYCPSPQLCAPEDCPGGWYCPTSLIKLLCPIGFYCPLRSRSPVPCPLPTRLCNREGLMAPLTISTSLKVSSSRGASRTVRTHTLSYQAVATHTAGITNVTYSISTSLIDTLTVTLTKTRVPRTRSTSRSPARSHSALITPSRTSSATQQPLPLQVRRFTSLQEMTFIFATITFATQLAGGSVISASVGSAAVRAVQFTALEQHLSRCQDTTTDDLDFASSPSQLRFGNERGAAYRGAVVGNVLVMAAASGLVYLVVLMAVPFTAARPKHNTFWEAYTAVCEQVQLPGRLMAMFAFLSQPILMSSFVLFVIGGPLDITLGLVGTAMALALPTGWCFFVITIRFRAVGIAADSQLSSNRLMRILTGPQTVWSDAGTEKVSFCSRYEVVFGGYRHGREWFFNIDNISSLAAGLIGGGLALIDGSTMLCNALTAALGGVCAVVIIVSAILRPYNRVVDCIPSIGFNILTVLWAVVAVAADDDSGDRIALVQSIASTVLVVMDMFIKFSRRRRLCEVDEIPIPVREWKHNDGNDEVSDPGRGNDDVRPCYAATVQQVEPITRRLAIHRVHQSSVLQQLVALICNQRRAASAHC